MKIDNHTYANIVRNTGDNYYKVIITKTFDIIMFNKTIKQYETKQLIPFYFKKKDIAIDFCNMLPDKITKKTFKIKWHSWFKNYIKKYITYELKVGKHKIYVYWANCNKDKLSNNDTIIKIITPSSNIIEGFVPKISLYKDNSEFEYSSAYYDYNSNYDKLTDLINYLNKDTIYCKPVEEYKFELVEQ